MRLPGNGDCSTTVLRYRSVTVQGVWGSRIILPRIQNERFCHMDIETLRDMCRELPAVTEDIKWGHDLCFSVAGKMFCVAALEGPLTVSFKVKDEEFDELSNSPGMRPAPYVARYKWVLVEEVNKLSRKEWAHYVKQSYELVKAKLPKKLAREHGLA